MANIPAGDVTLNDEVLGKGARFVVRGATYRGQPVAVKTVADPRRSDPFEVETALQAECNVLFKLKHRNIVQAYGLWRPPGGQLHLVMERVDGRQLSQVIRVCQAKRGMQGARYWDEATQEIVRQIGSALSHAHARGVFHNDLKPDNVLLRLVDGEIVVKLVDFEASGPTNARGRPEYAAPERIEREPSTVRSDVYSFGVLIYNLLTGTVPYPEEEPDRSLTARDVPIDELTGVVQQKAWRWLERFDGVAPALRRALARQPKDRQRDIATLLRELDAAAQLEASGVRPPPLAPVMSEAAETQLGTPARLFHAVVAALALVLALLVIFPLGDGALQRRLLARNPLDRCVRSLQPLAGQVCAILGGPPQCTEALSFLASMQECHHRTSELKQCIDVYH